MLKCIDMMMFDVQVIIPQGIVLSPRSSDAPRVE